MSDKQNQSVGPGGQAIQSRGDVIIHQSLSPSQMAEIIVALSKELAVLTAEAADIANARLEQFKADMMGMFAKTDKGNPEAFRDPGFQLSFREAQKTYVKSGDDVLRGTLIDMIARRSKETERTRLAIILDDAIIKAGSLGPNEFAELSFTFLLKLVQFDAANFADFCGRIQTNVVPFLDGISEDNTSYLHLESQGCASIVDFSGSELTDGWLKQYGGLLTNGSEPGDFLSIIPAQQHKVMSDTRFIIPCIHNANRLQPNAINEDVFLKSATASGLSEAVLKHLWASSASSAFGKDQMLERMRPHVPKIDKIFRLYHETPCQRLRLSTVGIAIGHADAVSKVGFSAPLDIWIR